MSSETVTNPTVTIVDPSGNLPSTRIEFSDTGFTAIVEASGGDARVFAYNTAGGHYELSLMKDLPDGNAQTLDDEGYIVPIKD